jgi:hypothetical protein
VALARDVIAGWLQAMTVQEAPDPVHPSPR